jgi:hypothetical protein
MDDQVEGRIGRLGSLRTKCRTDGPPRLSFPSAQLKEVPDAINALDPIVDVSTNQLKREVALYAANVVRGGHDDATGAEEALVLRAVKACQSAAVSS